MKKSNSDRLKALKLVSREIKKLEFAPLERPQVPSGAQPTLELLDWATRLYCYSILSHFRELLTSLVFLSEAERGPAVFIIARSLSDHQREGANRPRGERKRPTRFFPHSTGTASYFRRTPADLMADQIGESIGGLAVRRQEHPNAGSR